jgi:hypothetical protein
MVEKLKSMWEKLKEIVRRLVTAVRKKFAQNKTLSVSKDAWGYCKEIRSLITGNLYEENVQKAEAMLNRMKSASKEETIEVSMADLMKCISDVEIFIKNGESEVNRLKSIGEDEEKNKTIQINNARIKIARVYISAINYVIGSSKIAKAKKETDTNEDSKASESYVTIWDELLICE